MQRTSRRLPALLAAALLITAVLGLACSGGSKSSAPSSSPAANGTEPSGSAAGAASGITTSVQAAAATGTVGGEVEAVVLALGVAAPGLGAWTIDVAYDPAVVSVTGCVGTENSACNPRYEDRTVRLAGAAGTGLQGDVTLMTLTFTCDAAGTSPLTVDVVLIADATIGNPLAIDATTQDGSVTCS
jgi:hypothetical protein